MCPELRRLLSNQRGIGLCWLGNLSWLIRAGDTLIGFDLDLDREYRAAPSPIATDQIAPHLDVHFITHEHEDHFSSITSGILAAKSTCLFILPTNCVEKGLGLGLGDDRIQVAVPGEPFELPRMHVEPMHALHGGPDTIIQRDANFDDCGYLFTIGGLTFLQPGDSVLLREHLDAEGIDVLFISPTVHNMPVDRATILINALQPNLIIPQHYGTYTESDTNLFWTRGYPDQLQNALAEPMQQRYRKLNQGEVFTIG